MKYHFLIRVAIYAISFLLLSEITIAQTTVTFNGPDIGKNKRKGAKTSVIAIQTTQRAFDSLVSAEQKREFKTGLLLERKLISHLFPKSINKIR